MSPLISALFRRGSAAPVMRAGVFVLCFVAGPPAIAQQPQRDTTADTTLASSAARLRPVTITATPAARSEPLSVKNVNPVLLRTTPAINPYDLLRQTAGIEVHDQGQGPGFASDASVRGFSSDHSTDLALWIDGVPINEPVNGHAEGYSDWSLIFPQAVNDVDVIKGPASALFGNFALSGVVNVRTIERLRDAQAWLSGGANGRAEAAVLSGFDRTGEGGVFGLRGLREDGWRPNSAYSLGQGHGRYVRDLTPMTTIDAGVELYGSRWDSPGFITVDQFDAGKSDTVANPTDGGFKRRAQERVSLRMLRGNGLWRSTLYATQGRWVLFLTTPPEGGGAEGSGAQTEEQDSRFGFGATSALTRSFPSGDFTVGVEGRFDRSRYENWQDTVRARQLAQERDHNSQLSGALFAESRTELGDRATLMLGARYDGVSTTRTPFDSASENASHSVLSPKIGMLVRFIPGVGLYANVSRGFRSSDNVNAHPELGLITAWSYEAGAKLDRSGLSASAAFFRMDVSDDQQFSEICACTVSGGASRRDGIELAADARLGSWWTADADWTFLDAKYRRFETETGAILTDAVRVFNTARYVGTAAVAVGEPSGAWSIRLSGNAVGPYTPFDETPGFEVPAYGLLHASGTVRALRTTLVLGVRNLLDRAYPELRGGGFVSPGQPRSVYASLETAF